MVKFAKALAANTDQETAQSFVFQQDQIFFGLLISAVGDDCFTQVRQAASEVEEQFFEAEGKTSDKLEVAFNFLKEKLSGLEEPSMLLSGVGSDSILYLKGVGAHKAYILRGGQVSLLTSDLNSQLISGYLQAGDRLLLVSDGLGEDPQKLFEAGVDNFEEEVNSFMVSSSANPSEIRPLAGALLDYSLNEPQAEVSEVLTQQNIPNLEEQSPSERRFNFDLAGFRDNLVVALDSVRSRLPQTRKGRLYLGLALILVVLLGVFISVKHKSQSQKDAQFAADLSQAQNEYAQAENLKDLDSASAQDSLNKAKQDLNSALALKPDDGGALNLKKEIDSSTDDILKVYTVNYWPTFLDLNLIKNGFSSSRLSLSTGNILLLDTNQNTLVEINLAQKANNILAGPLQLGSSLFASLNGDFAYVFSDKGVVKVDTKAVQASVAVPTDTQWGKIADLYGFGGNIYLLDEISNQIWKYTPAATSYSSKIPYLQNGTKADFAGAKRMLIDSSIWILKEGSEVDKYTAGVPDSFNISGLDKPLKEVTAFFVSSDTSNIYLLDSGNSRLVVFNKQGQYVSQYQGSKFSDASDVVVDEQGKKIYLLEGNKIYQIDLH